MASSVTDQFYFFTFCYCFCPPPVSDTPLEFIVEYLSKAKDIADSNANVPEELKENLQKALDIASGLDSYLERMTSQESEPLAELYK